MTVIVGIGIPGCGKTTFLKPLAHELGMLYINPDDIREELTGDATNHTRETEVWALVHRRLELALPETGVVVDATYTKRRDRRELIERCRTGGSVEIVAYWFDPPLETCLQRNAGRARVVPEAVLARMHRRLHATPPSLDEGFTEIRVIRD